METIQAKYGNMYIFVYSISLLNIILTGSDPDQFKTLLQSLNTKFHMKDLGTLHYFLGIQVTFSPDGLFLSQSKYAEDILYQASMDVCNSMATPLPSQINSVPADTTLFSEPKFFRSIAGKLQYLTLTRPDIQYAVNFVCQRMHSPTVADFAYLKRILRYLRGTSSFGLRMSQQSSLILSAYSDSDWAGCKETRRSTTGFCTFLGQNIVSWCAKKIEHCGTVVY